ncbi:MAG: amidohydrolase/deacetylase family metallohydrolase [Chloroflexi bacterium]|nr:amidohydrolase/deacetylase family metallohydrolase [Chloroflexota bacterium]|tara:strand:- start:3531 stop:4697 length:1167 start_codon:yes stop_codon:yes gene_type:complete
MTFDLVIKNGLVIDPKNKIQEKKDIGISSGKIRAIETSIPDRNAIDIIEAENKLVLPGLVDLHVHVWWGVAHLAVEADPFCLERGVTTAIDAGSSGANTISGFQKYVISQAKTRILAFLHISGMGQLDNDIGELEDIRWARVEKAVEASELHSDHIVGIKVRLSHDIVGKNDIEAFERALQVAKEIRKPLMIHIGGSHNTLEHILPKMRPGDIVTHAFTQRPHGILDNNNKVIDIAWDAYNRNVIFDVGHGAGSFSFPVAEACLDQGIAPNTISSDIHKYNARGPVFDLLTTLSKYLQLGLSLNEVIAKSSFIPAEAVNMDSHIGTIQIDSDADIAIVEHLKDGKFNFTDAENNQRIGNELLVPEVTLRKGIRFNPKHKIHRKLLSRN